MWSALASLGGTFLGGIFGSKEASKNRKFQKSYVQHRVADAKKAGIHPYYALGAGGGYSPVSSGVPEMIANGITEAGRAAERGDERKARNRQMSLQERVAESEIGANNARTKLLESQALNIQNQIKNGMVGRKGGVNPTPDTQYDGQRIPYLPGTSDAEDIERKQGNVISDVLGLLSTIEDATKNHDKKNPIFWAKRKGGWPKTVYGRQHPRKWRNKK